MSHSNIHILGAGLLGKLIAWQLSAQYPNLAIQLYDSCSEQSEQSAAWVAAAMLAPTAEAIDGTQLVTQLGYQSLTIWRQWLAELPNVFFQQNGSLIVWHPQDKALSQQFIQQLNLKHPNNQLWQNWDSQDIKQHEPQLASQFQQGLYLPTEAQIDNRQLLQALTSIITKHPNIHCHWHTTIQSPHKLISTSEWIIDCRGIGSQTDWNQLSGSQLRGVRGEVIRIHTSEVQLNRPVRLLHPRYPIYIVPKPNNIFVIGATQIETEQQHPITIRSSLELLSALYTVHPAFSEASILETQVGLRPTLNHDNPEIRYQADSKIISINGLYRHGFMIAPMVVQAAIQLLSSLNKGEQIPTFNPHSHIPYTLIN